MYCSYCGTQLPEGASFCSNCGKPVAGGGQPINAPAPAPAPRERLCTVTIQRTNQYSMSMVDVDVIVDGRPVGVLLNGGLLTFDVTAGAHQIIAAGVGGGFGSRSDYNGTINGNAEFILKQKFKGMSLERVK